MSAAGNRPKLPYPENDWRATGAHYSCSMPDDRTLRIHALNAEARELGYRIEVQTITHRQRPRHRAFAHRLEAEQPEGRFLWGSTDVLEAMEKGLEVLRGVVKEGHPWPGEETRDEQSPA